MPYICMATDVIPDGTLQVLDLQPNTSQRLPTIDPPGQTKYINRAQNESCAVITVGTSGVTNKTAKGLTGYLIQHVEPCGLEDPDATVTLVGAVAGDTVTIAGVVFTCQDGAPNAALQQFRSTAGAGSNNAAAITLAATINDAASQALITAALGNGNVIAATRTDNVITLTGDAMGSQKVNLMTLASSSGVRLAVSSAFLALSTGVPTAAQYADAAADILARVDAGSTCTLANINTILTTSLGGPTELTDAGGSRSTGSLTDVLEILAGRGYEVAAGDTIFATATTAPVWQANNLAGDFVSEVPVYGTSFANGEWNVMGSGTTENREVRGSRRIVDSTAFRASLLGGQLSVMQDGARLFPNSNPSFISWTHQRTLVQPFDGNQRLVTVYEDDGTLAS